MDPVVERILDATKQAGMDQKTLARRIDIRPQAITEWKKGVTSSYSKYLTQIADVLDTTVEYLLTGQKTPATGKSGDGQAEKLAAALAAIGVDVETLSDEELARIARIAKAALDG